MATFANALGLRHQSAVDLLAQISASGSAILYVDGIDRIKSEHRGIVTDLLHAIERDAALRHWRVVVTSRDQGLEVLRSWIPASLYAKTGVGDVAIETLNDAEAEDLATHRPELRPLLFGTEAVQEIARRPFFAAVLADQVAAMGLDIKAPPQTESELIEAWWAVGGYNVPSEAADGRQRALLDLAEIGAPSLGKGIGGRNLKPETIGQLENLRRDKIVDASVPGSVYKFTHDIFFEWVFFRLLIDRGDDWPKALTAAGEPPLLARIVSLHSQFMFEGAGDWSGNLDALSSQPLRPQWRRAWLLGPSASSHFREHRPTFEGVLFADGAALLAKFLVWFQAERTIPNPLLLQNPSTALEGAALIRAADQWGWPSDVAAWRRVLGWVFARHGQFPAAALPLVVELFAVWQNMLSNLQNPFSERIVGLAEAWLAELEGEEPGRWQGLRADTRESVEKTLRNLILGSALAYPDPAQRMVDRVIGVERRGKLFELIVAFSPILAQISPDKLAQLVLAEVIEPLPSEELEKERRSRDQGNAHRAAIRAKPQAERTEHEKRILRGLFMSLGMKTYDFNDTGIDRMHGSFYPPSPAHEPFASLFQYAPDVARAVVRTLSNRATEAWLQVHDINAPRYGTPLPLDIDFPWGRQRFWGGQRTYAWYFGEGGPQPLDAAFLTMTHWAHKRLEEGRELEELIHEVVEGHDNVAALGLAVSLALEKVERLPAVFSLISSQRLWHLDFRRQIEESAREINFFGLDPRNQMTSVQKTADAYLKARHYRQRSLKDLSYVFALSKDEPDKTKFREALQRFPAELPYEYEEQKEDDTAAAGLAETAQAWSNFWRTENYGLEPIPDQPGMAALTYSDPEPVSPAVQRRREDSANSLRDTSVVTWATKSFQQGKVEERISLSHAIGFAQSRDSTQLFDAVAEAGAGMMQNCVVAAAAMAIRFSDDAKDREWGWSIMDRVDGITERQSYWRYGNNPYDPRLFYMAVLKGDLAGGRPRADSAARLLTLAGNPNPYIAQFALAALLDAKALQPALVWNAAALATELFIAHQAFQKDGTRDGSVQEAYLAEATGRAVARLGGQGKPLAPLTIPPGAWVRQAARPKRKQREEHWSHPDPDFDQHFAKDVIRHFPIESWAASAEHREALLQYADELVRWTADRLFPSWLERRERESCGTQLYEWLSALATFVARVATLVPDGYARFIEPIAKHDDREVLTFVSNITEAVTTRHIYDASTVSDEALGLLGNCMDRMLTESTFNPNSHRAGDINTNNLSRMVKSFLLISVKDAPGAARFANGEWVDLPRLLPLIEKLMMAAGWSSGVMDAYLLLCERAKSNFPVEAFTRHASASMDATSFRQESWNSSGTSAGVSTAVQRLAEAHYPLTRNQARDLLILLDRLVDMGDRRAAALQQSEHFRSIQRGWVTSSVRVLR